MFADNAAYTPIGSPEPPSSLRDGNLRRREAKLAAREKQVNGLFYLNLVILIVAAGSVLHWGLSEPFKLRCAKELSPYSPVWSAVEFWEGELVNYFNHTSIYRGPPTLERETAWDELWKQPGIGIDDAGLAALNKSRPGLKHVPTTDSDPNHPTYATTLEVFHQLHCLNLIRQATWPLRQFNKSWGDVYPWTLEDRLMGRMHVDHCLETLRLSLMCYSDITPVLAEVAEHRKIGVQLDFNVHHKCRNFDKIVDYVRSHKAYLPDLGLEEQNSTDAQPET